MPSPPPTSKTSCPGRRRDADMPSSSFPDASLSSSASSPLSYLIPARTPPPPLLLMGQGYGVVNGVGVASSAAPPLGPATTGSSMRAGATGPPPRPPPRQCPRCGSANTKFCYYNNYSRSQPRYLCRACRRHWTEGGMLRDVPVGGGRKNRRGGTKAAKASSSSFSSAAAVTAALQNGVAFPDVLRQVLFQPVGTMGGGYSIDLSAWQQQMAAATAPTQGASDAGALGLGGTTTDANCGALQYWTGWQQDDMPGLDGAC